MDKTIHILIGPQGSGKTYWAQNILMQHRGDVVRISQDEQGKSGHRDLFYKCIAEGKSVVVDRMNFNIKQRSRYLNHVAEKGYKVILVWFNFTKNICLDRLASRKDHPTIAKDADHSAILDFYFNEFEQPKHEEYEELLTINEKGLATTLDIVNICHDKKIIVVGDIHGHFDKFTTLLDKCRYRIGDVVISTGDLVDRGPKIRETLQWFRNTNNAYVVMGNHDNKLMRYWKGNPVKINNGLNCTIEQCCDFDQISWSSWIQSFPHIIMLTRIQSETCDRQLYVVHAGIEGRTNITKQKIETCLYTRFVDGEDFFDKENGTPWWQTLDGQYSVASGHIMTDVVNPNNYTYCLDAGVCQTGCLRCLVIENQQHYIEQI